jgi:hypothetical protein
VLLINFAADEVVVETLRVIEGDTADCKLNSPHGICIDLEGVHWHDGAYLLLRSLAYSLR